MKNVIHVTDTTSLGQNLEVKRMMKVIVTNSISNAAFSLT